MRSRPFSGQAVVIQAVGGAGSTWRGGGLGGLWGDVRGPPSHHPFRTMGVSHGNQPSKSGSTPELGNLHMLVETRGRQPRQGFHGFLWNSQGPYALEPAALVEGTFTSELSHFQVSGMLRKSVEAGGPKL